MQAADPFQMQVRTQYGSLVDGLIALNPKKRKPWAQWIVFVGCLFVLVSLGGDRQVRDALFSPRLPARAPTAAQVVAQAQPPVRAFQQRPAAQPVQVAPAVAFAAPQQPAALRQPAPLVGMPLFATPGIAPQQIDPGAEQHLPGAKAQRGPTTKRAHTGKKR